MCNKKIISKIYPAWICKNCIANIAIIDKIYCQRCGSFTPDKCICPRIKNSIKKIRSCLIYDGTGKLLIHKWKYNKIFFIKDYFERVIIKKYPFKDTCIDAVIAVPVHFFRKVLRGFNQAEVIAETISKNFHINNISKIAKRVKYTKSQSLCRNYKERNINITKAFNVKKYIKFNKILIVDDIITSGSTINEFSKIFPESEIYVFTLAMAL